MTMAMTRNEVVGSSSSSPSKKSGNAKKSSPSSQPHSSSSSPVPTMSTGNNDNLPICIVDNGGWTVKFGLLPPVGVSASGVENTTTAATTIPAMSSIYNATARPPHQLTVLSGDEITLHMKNLGQLSWKYSLERGMICDGETQLRVWNRVLENVGVIPKPSGGAGFLGTISSTATRRGKQPPYQSSAAIAAQSHQQRTTTYSSNDCTFLLLEPPFVLSVISEIVDCILFRELGLGRVARLLGPCMAAIQYLSFCQSMPTMTYPPNDTSSSLSSPPPSSELSVWSNDNTNCCCVVDSGYSFTHIVPTHQSGNAIVSAIRRLDIGGKVLTNLLKEYVTYRQWNMMDEYHIVNDVKEQLCFVSDQFDVEMTKARNVRKGMRWFDREYLLPDFVNTFRGSVRLPEPLQRKRELEEMEQMKLDMERGDTERERRELAEEARELQKGASNAVEGTDKNGDESTVLRETNGSKAIKADNVKCKKHVKKKNRSTRKECSSNADVTEEDGDIIMDDSDTDSEDETDQQRLHRLKAMRDAERKRRAQESLERQALAMSVERFAIPEVLFRPSDIGLDCGGVAEAIVESISACPSTVRAAMYHNILLVGGDAKIPGFHARVETELRKLAPTNYEVRVYLPDDPVSYAWEGAKQFAQRAGFQEQFSIDRVSWETMKKAGKNQHEIWSNKSMTS